MLNNAGLNKKSLSVMLDYIYIIVFILYVIEDSLNSANTASKNSDRLVVYLLLSTLAILMLIRVLISKRLLVSNIASFLWIITSWIIIVNLLNGSFKGLGTVHIALSIQWVLTYNYFSVVFSNNNNAYMITFKKFITTLVLIYTCFSIYGSWRIYTVLGRIPVLNLSLYILALLPLILLFSPNKLKTGIIICLIMVTSASFKRVSLIMLPIMLSSYYLVKSKVENYKRSVINIVSILVVFGAFLLLVNFISNGFLSMRLTSTYGRENLYNRALEILSERSFWQLLIGSGSGSSVEAIGHTIHNEWIEFIFSFGLVGIVIYIAFMITLIRRFVNNYRRKQGFAPAQLSALVYMLFIQLTEGLYFSHQMVYIIIFLAFVNYSKKTKII